MAVGSDVSSSSTTTYGRPPLANSRNLRWLLNTCRCVRPVHGSPRPHGIGTQIDGLANERPMPCIAIAEMRMTRLRDEKKPSSSSRTSKSRMASAARGVAATQRDPGHQRAA
jgi:hypothetical protein